MIEIDENLVRDTIEKMLNPFKNNLEKFRDSDGHEFIVASIVTSITMTIVNGWALEVTDSPEMFDLAFDYMMRMVTNRIHEEFYLIKSKRGMH